MIFWTGNIAGFVRRQVLFGLGLPAPRYSVQTSPTEPVLATPDVIAITVQMAQQVATSLLCAQQVAVNAECAQRVAVTLKR